MNFDGVVRKRYFVRETKLGFKQSNRNTNICYVLKEEQV